jgi:hypothetical protein
MTVIYTFSFMNFYLHFTRQHFLVLIQIRIELINVDYAFQKKQQSVEREIDLKSKGLGWISTMKFMWLWGRIIPLNPLDIVFPCTEKKFYFKIKNCKAISLIL